MKPTTYAEYVIPHFPGDSIYYTGNLFFQWEDEKPEMRQGFNWARVEGLINSEQIQYYLKSMNSEEIQEMLLDRFLEKDTVTGLRLNAISDDQMQKIANLIYNQKYELPQQILCGMGWSIYRFAQRQGLFNLYIMLDLTRLVIQENKSWILKGEVGYFKSDDIKFIERIDKFVIKTSGFEIIIHRDGTEFVPDYILHIKAFVENYSGCKVDYSEELINMSVRGGFPKRDI